MLRFQRFGFCDGSFHAFGPWRQDDLRAKGFQQVSAFDAHRVGHRQDQSVFANGGDERQADSGVAAGRLDDDAARFEQAFFLCVVDHGQRYAVFHAAGRIEIFEFCNDPGGKVVFAAVLVQFEQRSVADQIGQSFGNFFHRIVFYVVYSLGGRAAETLQSQNCYFHTINRFRRKNRPGFVFLSGQRSAIVSGLRLRAAGAES